MNDKSFTDYPPVVLGVCQFWFFGRASVSIQGNKSEGDCAGCTMGKLTLEKFEQIILHEVKGDKSEWRVRHE